MFSFRLLGLVPFLLFLARLRQLWQINDVGGIFWMCHLSNLGVAIALWFKKPLLLQVSVLWLALGFPLWIWDMIRDAVSPISSFGTHVGGLAIGLTALFRSPKMQRGWPYALGWFLITQQFCRLFTPAESNVNVAHKPYPIWEDTFKHYWQHWLSVTLMAILCLFGVEQVLQFTHKKVTKIKQ